MVKAGEGSSVSSTSSSATPSSPTRKLKTCGKRGRRLCYKEGCMLCPSFGYEGSAAVSCSRHKGEGMQNLTARRCQHASCFTAANFGIPGDKPRFCAAHSTEGMVNRNKPRGGKVMGIIASRSSLRTTKKINSVYDGDSVSNKQFGMFEAAPAAEAETLKGSPGVGSCPVSGGEDIRVRAATGTRGIGGTEGGFGVYGGDRCGLLTSKTLTNARPRGSGRSAIIVGDYVASVEHGSPVSSMDLTSKGDKANDIMYHKRTSSSMSVRISMPPCDAKSGSKQLCRAASVTFVSRGDGLGGPSAGGSGEKPTGGKSGDIKNGGRPSFFMDGLNYLKGHEVDSDLGLEIGATLDILGVGRDDDVKAGGFDLKECHEQEPFLGRCCKLSAMANSTLRSSANGNVMRSPAGLILNGPLPAVDSVIGGFDIDHFSELNSAFLSGLRTEHYSQDSRQQQQQGHYLCSGASNSGNDSGRDVPSASLTPYSCLTVATGVANGPSADAAVRSTPTPATSTQTTPIPRGTPSASGTPVDPGAFVSSKHPWEETWWDVLEERYVAVPELVWGPTAQVQEVASVGDVIRDSIDATMHSTRTPATPMQTPVTPRGTISAPNTSEKAWCYRLVEEKAVAMSEPVWGPTTEEQELASADDVITNSIYHDYDNLGGGYAGRRPRRGKVTVPGVFTEVGFSPTPCRVNSGGGNRGMGSGGACLSPHKNRHQDSLEGFGLAIVPNSGLSNNGGHSMTMASSTLTPASQTDVGEDVGIAREKLRESSGVMGYMMEDAWLNGDTISPSTTGISLSPNKSARPLLSQFTSPWAADDALCSDHQTKAAGRP